MFRTEFENDSGSHPYVTRTSGSEGAALMEADCAYCANGLLQQVTYASGASTAYAYYDSGLIWTIAHHDGSGLTLLDLSYSYDARDLPELIIEHHADGAVVNVSYIYDDRGRLIAESRDGDGSLSERRNRLSYSTARYGSWCYDVARCSGYEFGSATGPRRQYGLRANEREPAMRLYLVRHGEAVPKETDPQRPLSDEGRTEVETLASFIGAAGIRVGHIMHSGKPRAEQTAEILATAVGTGAQVEGVSGLDPLDPTEPVAESVNEWSTDTMVVGHLPFLAKLASRLVVGHEAAAPVVFQASTVVCLARSEDGVWSILWAIPPALVAGTGGA